MMRQRASEKTANKLDKVEHRNEFAWRVTEPETKPKCLKSTE